MCRRTVKRVCVCLHLVLRYLKRTGNATLLIIIHEAQTYTSVLQSVNVRYFALTDDVLYRSCNRSVTAGHTHSPAGTLLAQQSVFFSLELLQICV